MGSSQELHTSVLLNESIEALKIRPQGIYVDCTLGRGGHALRILKQLTTGKLIGIDQDDEAINYTRQAFADYGDKFLAIHGNFADLKMLLAQHGISHVDGIIYDLGVSSPQFDVGERGFSYRFDGPLDMRMDQNQVLTAYEVVNNYDEKMLADILYKYGSEAFSRQIAKQIVADRPIKSTLQLVETIKKVLPQKVLKQKKHPAKKTFQALRVYVNHEIEALEKSLIQGLEILNSKGRMVVITFQSHEEEVVRNIFKKFTLSQKNAVLKSLPVMIDDDSVEFKLITKSPIKPLKIEVEKNFRSHSSKM
jgi:16S rRNA (cytosine1402-N4)-methyltransferase